MTRHCVICGNDLDGLGVDCPEDLQRLPARYGLPRAHEWCVTPPSATADPWADMHEAAWDAYDWACHKADYDNKAEKE